MTVIVTLLCFVPPVMAQEHGHTGDGSVNHLQSITDHSFEWPGWDQVGRVVFLQDHTTRVVVIGTALLGIAAGVIGTFAYLRKRALMGDALSHATLPGIAAMFLITQSKSLPLLLIGASVTGVLGVLAVIGMRHVPRVREDAAIGIVLSVFFGAGVVLLGLVQEMKTGGQAGLGTFIYGRAASMLSSDAWFIGCTAAAVLIGCALLFKEFRAVCFDPGYAATQGLRVTLVDTIMMALVVLTTVVGLQAVGLILVIALLIVPAAGARFWTDRLGVMVVAAGVIGGVSCWVGASFSALLPRLPTGAVIVIVAGVVFGVSMLAAPRRGVLADLMRRWKLSSRIRLQHLLRALAELEEEAGGPVDVAAATLLPKRSWGAATLHRQIRKAASGGLLEASTLPMLRLSPAGRVEARRILRNHRLWELYLILHADIAPSHVDRDADEIEHVLPEHVVDQLEAELAADLERTDARIPASPHTDAMHPASPHPRGALAG